MLGSGYIQLSPQIIHGPENARFVCTFSAWSIAFWGWLSLQTFLGCKSTATRWEIFWTILMKAAERHLLALISVSVMFQNVKMDQNGCFLKPWEDTLSETNSPSLEIGGEKRRSFPLMKRSNGLFSGANWLLVSGSVEFPEISFFRLDSHLGRVFLWRIYQRHGRNQVTHKGLSVFE